MVKPYQRKQRRKFRQGGLQEVHQQYLDMVLPEENYSEYRSRTEELDDMYWEDIEYGVYDDPWETEEELDRDYGEYEGDYCDTDPDDYYGFDPDWDVGSRFRRDAVQDAYDNEFYHQTLKDLQASEIRRQKDQIWRDDYGPLVEYLQPKGEDDIEPPGDLIFL